MDYKKVDRLVGRIEKPTKTPFQKALGKAKAKAKQYSSGPQKGKMSNKRLSEMVSRMGKKKTLDKLRDMRGTISDKELDFARSMLPKMNTGGEMLKNPKKADLDKDGKLSGYEKKRGMAIEKSMSGKRFGGVMKKSKGGGADTGKKGEMKSKLGVAINKFKRRIKGSVSNKELDFLKRQAPKLQAPERKPMKPLKAMGGGMMNKPMGYKKGTMIMARGCKLGRKKATKIT